MKSEIGGGVDGRSTYFTHEQHVDDQNSHRQDREERDIKDNIGSRNNRPIITI